MSLKPHYLIISSLFLISCFDFLNKEEPEQEEEDSERSEGENSGDCTDGEDNDDDGYVDCDDQGCWERPACSDETDSGDPDPPDDSLLDNDGDGFTIEGGDCDDDDANVYPGNEETPYDGVDNDCDESTLDDDLDGDGFTIESGDCDDDNPYYHPEADDSVCDDVDQNCDGVADDGWAGDQLEPNDTWTGGDETASNYYGEYGDFSWNPSIPDPLQFEGYLFPEGDRDVFGLSMYGGDLSGFFTFQHQVTLEGIPVDNTVELQVEHYTSGGGLIEMVASDVSSGTALSLTYEPPDSGYYLFRVISLSGQDCSAQYTLTIQYTL